MTIGAAQRRAAASTARLAARVYAASGRALRLQLLSSLLRPLSPLAIAAVAAGGFAATLRRDGLRPTIEQAAAFSAAQIAELARFVEQVDPEALVRFALLSADNSGGLTAFGAAALALLLRSLSHGGTR